LRHCHHRGDRSGRPGYQARAHSDPERRNAKDALLRGVKVFDQFDVDSAMELYEYSGKEETKFVRLGCEYEIAISRVEQAIREKWGQDAGDAFVHALSEMTAEDYRQADVEMKGDRATVHFKVKDSNPVPMVRVVLKLAIHDMVTAMGKDDLTTAYRGMAAVRDGLPKIANDVKSGKLRKPDDVSAAAKKLVDEASQPAKP
jgi:hypothetical protein